jgi:beta-ureidopropionase / N-carbamoyl-L-amino-acid hydrolase
VYTRREVLAIIGGAAVAGTELAARPRLAPVDRPPGLESPPGRLPGVDAARLRSRLEALSVFGRPTGVGFEGGVSRVAYSDADVAARSYVLQLMRDAGLSPRIDPAGNIFARREGRDASLKPILFGSHIDSVPQGGNFDGDLGSLSALGAVEALRERGHVTRHPLEIVVWAHEESAAFNRGLAGSRIVAGDFVPADLEQTWNGLRRDAAIRRIGGNPERIAEAAREKGSLHCYLELHIEQGATLHRQSIPVGVVQGIVAIDGFEVTVRGFANHAGTTVMTERQDALVAASQLTLAVREIVTVRPGRQVGTVGRFDVSPNSPNVIPGEVRLSIELRDLSEATLQDLADAIRARAQQIARDTRTTIELTPSRHNPPATADTHVQDVVARAADRLGLGTTRMPSGAGHDAQMMARLCPMGMIFVPSIDGISHSPRELTTWEDCARGARVLLDTVLAMDED